MNVIAISKIKNNKISRHINLTISFVFLGRYPKKYLSKKLMSFT